MKYGLRVFDNFGKESLTVDSFSMRAVTIIKRDGIRAEGEDIYLTGFDPGRGVVVVSTYEVQAEVNFSQDYSIEGSFPNAYIRFEATYPDVIPKKKYIIMGVHYK